MFPYILIVMVLKPIHSNLILKETKNHASDLIEFTLKIIENEFKDSQTALVINNERDLNANRFLEKYSHLQHQIAIYSIHLDNYTTGFDEFYSEYKPDLTIIFVDKDNYQNINAVIFGIELFPFWNIRGTFLVVVAGVPDEYEEDWLENGFRKFWERQALRVYICFWLNGVKLLTYNPFLDNYNIDISNTDLSLILNQKITNMYGYPFKTMYFDLVMPGRGVEIERNGRKEWAGGDGVFQECIRYALNATLEVFRISEVFDEKVIANTDVTLPYSIYLRELKSVYDFDMLFNSAITYDDSLMDRIFLYEKNEVQIIVPNEKQIPTYLTILLIVNWDVWCASLGSLIAVSVTIIIIRKFRHINVDIVNVFLDNYRFFLNESPPSREQRYQERVLLVFWVFHCIVFATLYQTILLSTLVTPKFYPDMNSLQDLFKTNMNIRSDEFIKYKLRQTLTGQDRVLLKHLVHENLTKYGESILWIGKYEFEDNYGFMLSKSNIYEFFARLKTATSLYYVIKEVLLPGPVSFNIGRDKLYYNEVNMILSRIQDAGLPIYWRKYNYGIDRPKYYKDEIEHSDTQVFGVKHLLSAFLLLNFGYCLAFIGFCSEHIYRKCNTFPTQ